MLNLLLSIKWFTLLIGVLLTAAAILSFIPPVSWIAGFVCAPFAAMFLGIAYAGFKIQSKVEKTAQIAMDLAGEHVSKLSDEFVKRKIV